MKPRILTTARLSFPLASAIAALLSPPTAFAASTWNAGTAVSTDGSWSTATNWSADTLPGNGDALTFDGTANQTNTNNIPLSSIGSLTLNNAGWNITLGTVTLNSGLVANGNASVGGTTTLGGAQTWSNSTGLLTVTGSVANGGNLLTIGGAGNTSLSPVSGTGGLTKSGAGTLTLGATGDNSYSGATTVSQGTMVLNTLTTNAFTSAITINNGGTIKLGAADKVVDTATPTVNTGGIFDLNGFGETMATTAGSGTVTNTGALATLKLTGSTSTVANAITGALNLSIQGASKTYTLNGANTYTGSTTIGTGGTAATKAILGSSNALPSGTAVNVDGSSSNTVLDLNGFSATIGLLTLGTNNGGAQTTVAGTGSSKLTLTAGATVNGHNNGGGQISVATLDLNGATQTFTLTGSTNIASQFTVSSVIQNGALTRAGSNTPGSLILSGANTYSGNTINSTGSLTLSNSLALQNSALDTTNSIAGSSTAGLRTTVTTLTLGGLIGNKNFAATGGVFNTTAANSLYGNVTALTLKPVLGATPSYSGVIANGAAGMTLTKTGAGTQTLAGANTYTGATTVSAGTLIISGSPTGNSAVTVNAGGTLQLDYTTNSTSKINDSAVLTLGGGTLDLKGGTHTEAVASTALTAGTTSNVTSSTLGSVLKMGVITQGAGAKINFGASNIATTDTLNTNGIIGTWATVNGVDWASNSTNAAAGPIIAYTGYADVDAQGPTSTIADGATSNVRIFANGTSGTIELGATTTTINTLLQSNATTAATVNTAGKTLATGAVWIPSGKAALTIGVLANDGFLTAATAGGDLQLINDSSSGLTINSVIANNTSASSLTKLGTGSVTLNGTNTYSGATNLLAGTLTLGNASALGTGTLTINGGNLDSSVVNLVNSNTNALNWNSDFTFVGTQSLNLGTGGVTLNANRQVTVAANTLTIGGNIGGSFAITKAGPGTLALSGTNTYTGNTTVTGGTLNITGSHIEATPTSTLALGSAAANTVTNVSSDMTLLAITGAAVAGSSTAYNQTAGNVNISSTTLGGSFVAQIGYGYFNLTGGIFKSNGGFSIGTSNAAASSAVAYVGGTGFLDWSGANNQTVGYTSPAALTVGPGGSVSRGSSTNVTWLATNSGSSAILNIAGGSLDLGTAGNVYVNNTGSGGTSVTFNLAGGTLTMGKALLTNGSSSGKLYANYAGGTLKASATLASSPMNVLTSVSTVFGPITNNNNASTAFNTQIGTTSNFTGGLTIDTNGNSMPYGNILRGVTGNGVKQSNITVTGGSGYIGAPLVTFTGGTLTSTNGTPASGYAVISGGAVTGIVITCPGTYSVDPTVTLTGGGGSGASAALSALTANAADTGLTKINGGTLTLSGANTYVGGTSVTGGTLSFSGIPAQPTSGALAISSGAAVNLSNLGVTATWPTVNVTGAGTFNVILTGGILIDNSANYDMSGFTGIMDISGAGGRLTMNSPFVSPASTATIRVQNGSTAYLGYLGTTTLTCTVELYGTDDGENLGQLRVESGNQQNGPVVLKANSSIGSNGGIGYVGGLISDGGLGYGFTKQGAGTLALTGANTYSGATIISTGTLALGANNVLPDASAVSIDTATLNAATFSDTLGTLDLTGAAVVNLGSGATLAFADSNAVDWTGGTLNITGTFVSGSSIRFGTTSSGLTSGQLAVISVNGSGAGTYALDSSGYLINGGPGPVDHFVISAITGTKTVGTAITGITLTAKDSLGATATGFTGTVTFGGTGGFTGTSGSFVAGVLNSVSITPTNAGSSLTFTVDDGSSHTGSTTIATIQTQYDAWSGGAAFDIDSNGDGVKNGLAWLLGAADKDVSALSLLPTVSQNTGDLILTFNCLSGANRGSAALNMQYSKDLGITDLWTGHTAAVPGTEPVTSTVNGVNFVTTASGALIHVVATVPAAAAAPGSSLFGRLDATTP